MQVNRVTDVLHRNESLRSSVCLGAHSVESSCFSFRSALGPMHPVSEKSRLSSPPCQARGTRKAADRPSGDAEMQTLVINDDVEAEMCSKSGMRLLPRTASFAHGRNARHAERSSCTPCLHQGLAGKNNKAAKTIVRCS